MTALSIREKFPSGDSVLKKLRKVVLMFEIKYTDYGLSPSDRVIEQVLNEDLAQLRKWGIQSKTAFEWMNHLTEEVGELARAIAEHHYADGTSREIVREAVQVATLALKIAKMFELQE